MARGTRPLRLDHEGPEEAITVNSRSLLQEWNWRLPSCCVGGIYHSISTALPLAAMLSGLVVVAGCPVADMTMLEPWNVQADFPHHPPAGCGGHLHAIAPDCREEPGLNELILQPVHDAARIVIFLIPRLFVLRLSARTFVDIFRQRAHVARMKSSHMFKVISTLIADTSS